MYNENNNNNHCYRVMVLTFGVITHKRVVWVYPGHNGEFGIFLYVNQGSSLRLLLLKCLGKTTKSGFVLFLFWMEEMILIKSKEMF